jgi:hypothetical protein
LPRGRCFFHYPRPLNLLFRHDKFASGAAGRINRQKRVIPPPVSSALDGLGNTKKILNTIDMYYWSAKEKFFRRLGSSGPPWRLWPRRNVIILSFLYFIFGRPRLRDTPTPGQIRAPGRGLSSDPANTDFAVDHFQPCHIDATSATRLVPMFVTMAQFGDRVGPCIHALSGCRLRATRIC